MESNNKLLTDEQLLQFLIELRYNIENDAVVNNYKCRLMCVAIISMTGAKSKEETIYKELSNEALCAYSEQIIEELKIDKTGNKITYWYPLCDKQSRLDNIDRTIDRIKSRIL